MTYCWEASRAQQIFFSLPVIPYSIWISMKALDTTKLSSPEICFSFEGVLCSCYGFCFCISELPIGKKQQSTDLRGHLLSWARAEQGWETVSDSQWHDVLWKLVFTISTTEWRKYPVEIHYMGDILLTDFAWDICQCWFKCISREILPEMCTFQKQ